MAEVIITIDEENEKESLTPEIEELINSFNEKYKEINNLFNGSMVVCEDGEFSIFPELIGRNLSFSTRDTKESEGISKGVFKFFSSDIGGDCQFGFGEDPFDEEFYNDFFNLNIKCFDYEIDTEMIDFPELNIVVVGSPGYYTGFINLTKKGLKWEVNLYEEEEDSDW